MLTRNQTKDIVYVVYAGNENCGGFHSLLTPPGGSRVTCVGRVSEVIDLRDSFSQKLFSLQ